MHSTTSTQNISSLTPPRNWKKDFFIRGLAGMGWGVTISYILSIIISLRLAGGNFSPIAPTLAQLFDNQIQAVIVQFFCSLAIGFAFSSTSIFFEVDHWSLTKQTLLHFIVTGFIFFPVAFTLQWVPLKPGAIVGFSLFYVLLYCGIWLGFYLYWKQKLHQINKALKLR